MKCERMQENLRYLEYEITADLTLPSNDGIISFSTLANGDVIFSLPQLLANDISSTLFQVACQSDPGPGPFGKRQVLLNYPCAIENAQIAMKSVPLDSKQWNSLLLTPPLFPILKSGLTNEINQVYKYSLMQPQWAPKYVNETQLTTISTVMFVLATNHEYEVAPGLSIVSNTIPFSDIETETALPTTVVPSSTAASATASGGGRCPTVSFATPTPTSVVCGGYV